jgi:hypothetical protein
MQGLSAFPTTRFIFAHPVCQKDFLPQEQAFQRQALLVRVDGSSERQ